MFREIPWDFFSLRFGLGLKKGGEEEDVGSKGGKCEEEKQQKSECYI